MAERTGTHRVSDGARVAPRGSRGVVFVHSCPRALARHVEWALADVLGAPVDLDWSLQPVVGGTLRSDLSWTGPTGTAARVVSALRGWGRLRFEVTEEPTATTEGERYSVTPTLGVFRAVVGHNGDILVSEERLRGAMARSAANGEPYEDEVDILLGGPWDVELEPFRLAGEGSPVRWLHQVV